MMIQAPKSSRMHAPPPRYIAAVDSDLDLIAEAVTR